MENNGLLIAAVVAVVAIVGLVMFTQGAASGAQTFYHPQSIRVDCSVFASGQAVCPDSFVLNQVGETCQCWRKGYPNPSKIPPYIPTLY